MTSFHDFLVDRLSSGGFSTEDTLASVLPLMRQVQETHAGGLVAPLEGIDALHVEGAAIWFEEALRREPRKNDKAVRRTEDATRASVEIVAELRRTSEVAEDASRVVDTSVASGEAAVERPVYLPGYRAWEHAIAHHDPLTDVFSLGMILASLACGMDFCDPIDLEAFVQRRKNLFSFAKHIHPVLARVIIRMTELERHRRAQDLPALIRTLEHYRDQQIDFELDLARDSDFEQRDAPSKRSVVLTKLRERLFELSRRNRLLHFRPTMASVNLTHASVPLSFDIKNIRPDQILVWNDSFQKRVTSGKQLSLNQYLNFSEALYLPSLLDRIGAESRKDESEFGFAQLRLVACFLHWANLKETPAEQYDSPLVLLPVKLVKKKGIRDTYFLEVLATEAEINPVVRHQFKQLYDIDLPEALELSSTTLDAFFASLAAKVEASEPAISLNKIDRPRIALIHEKARRKLDHYRRRARLAGRGIRTFGEIEYSYDPANYHPLGVKIFSEKVRPPSTRLREIIEERPRPRSFAVAEPNAEADVAEKERSFFSLQDGGEQSPYTWSFDLCSITLANFRYRKMSLVRDYEALLENDVSNSAFDAVFSLMPRPATRELPQAAPLEERYDVVPCDPTQSTAIDEARAGTSYIIQGPPGTGKSQTITNLIADYVARGKRVLFVCEKRAAIDVVYARLRHCGLGNLCALIHDSQTDKKSFVMDLKQTYESFLDEGARASRKANSRDYLLREMQQELASLERFDAAMRDVPPHGGLSNRELLDRCVSLISQRPELTPLEKERVPNFAGWCQALAAVERFESRFRRVSPDGVLAQHPFRLLDTQVRSKERPLESVLDAARDAVAHVVRIREELGRSRIPQDQWDIVAKATQVFEYAELVRPLTEASQLRHLDAKSKEAKDLAREVGKLDKVKADLAEAREATVNWRTKLPATDVPAALEQAERLETSYFPWLKPAWWRLRSVIKRSYDFSEHVVRPSWSQLLRTLRREYEQVEKLEQKKGEIAQRLSLRLGVDDLTSIVQGIQEALPTLPDRVRRIHAAILKASDPEAITSRLDAAATRMEQFASVVDTVFSEVEDLAWDDLQFCLESIQGAADNLPDYIACLAELAELPATVRSALQRLPCTTAQLEAASADRTLELVFRADPWLAEFDGSSRSGHAANLADTYQEWLKSNAEELQERTRGRFRERVRIAELPAAQLSADEKEFKKRFNRGRRELEHEFGKSMRYKAIRDLAAGESSEVVRDLKPVWLMSPLSVSDTLPLDDQAFDVVIFDEASQITLEEAVPSVFRAAQTIVVGDEMQLPPTDFFSAKQRSDEDAELTFEEDGEAVDFELDSNSFLNHAARNLVSTMLGWHYRSRSESLISFSNWAFYDGRLLTVPEERLPGAGLAAIRSKAPYDGAAAAEDLLRRAVSFHQIDDGVYHNRRNAAEAEYIAQTVRSLLSLGRGLTIGVVAFSEAQQDEIESALGRLAEEDREFRELYEAELERDEDGQFMGLLVKNLENIQGDERDVIILSVCYGPNPDGKMFMNFGPINKSGGEKRLNVAFSRAKHHMAVVSSIQSTAITNDYNDGARCLKNYLRYAEAVSLGDGQAASRTLHSMARWEEVSPNDSRAEDNVVADQLAEVMRQKGFEVDRSVGQSHFRCDLALRLPSDEAYRLGVLIDNSQYYEQSDLLERDVMRPKLLENFGWRVCFVLAKDWYADREGVVARLVELADSQAPT